MQFIQQTKSNMKMKMINRKIEQRKCKITYTCIHIKLIHTYVRTCISICLSLKSNKFIANFIMHKNISFIHANPAQATETFPCLINVCLKNKERKTKKILNENNNYKCKENRKIKLRNSNRAENKKKAKHQKEASIVFSGQSADNKERERQREGQKQQAKRIRKKIGQQPEETVENKGKMGKKTRA